jgi:hypothetical protein
MSNRVRLACGCTVRIETGTRTRVIEARDDRCEQRHRPGGRIWLWELLVDPRQTAAFDGSGTARPQPLI